MKRYVLFIAFAFVILSVSYAFGDVAIDAANFPDANFRNYVSETFDIHGYEYWIGGEPPVAIPYEQWGSKYRDGKLDNAELGVIATQIDIRVHNLTSTKGFEYFSNIGYIETSGGNIGGNFDISGNCALTSVWCPDNHITSVNLDNNTLLQHIGFPNNELSSLILQNNSSLTELICNNNRLSELILSNCPLLQKLVCDENAIKELDLSNNSSLNYVDVSENDLWRLNINNSPNLDLLNCNNNQLTQLVVDSDTSLTKLYCMENKITALDLTNNAALEILHCHNNSLTVLDLAKNAALHTLFCGSNRLMSLNLSSDTALHTLLCDNNQLTELDLSRNTALTTLECFTNQLTELDLSHNTSLTQVECHSQKRKGLKIKETSQGYEVNMRNYVSHPENIDADSISPQPVSYSKTTGIIIFSEPITELRYNYITHSPNNDFMDVTITNPMIISALERSGFNADGLIIHDMTESSYLGNNGNALTESDISSLSYSDYGKLGLTADGNSRLIIRVQTDKPGTVSFSGYEGIGAKLEALTSRKELSASDQLNTTQIDSDTHQVSAVLVAPERFPNTQKNFPSDTFKIHVKFTDEEGEITEDDLELKLEAAPVILIPGEMNSHGWFLTSWGDADRTFGRNNNSGIWRELLDIGFKKEHIALVDYTPASLKSQKYILYDALKAMFRTYADEGIVCTKADVVAHGLGGLLVRQYLDESDKDSSSNNWLAISYRQGMIHKVVNISVPHRGTPLANVKLGDTSVINGDLGMKNLAYCVLKVWRVFCNEIAGSQYQWKDLALGSEVVSLPFPANVPMHFIYGDITSSLGGLEKVKDVLFLLKDLADLAKTLKKLPGRLSKLEESATKLDKDLTHAIHNGGIDESMLNEVIKLADDILLELWEYLKMELKIAQTGMSFIEMFAQSPDFTKLMQIAGVAMGGGVGLLKTFTVDLYFSVQDVIFSGQPHDLFVPKWSAIAAFPEYSTCFPVTPGIFDFLHFKYGEICHQTGVAEFVGYLLKAAPMSEFAVLKESVSLPGSLSAKTSSNGDSDSDIDIDFENFYVKNFSLTVRKTTRENFGDGMTALKFIAETTIKTSNDVKLVVQKDSLDRIFPMFTENGVRFEAVLVFSSSDEGEMTAYCYAPSGKGNLYISDTVNVEISAAIEENTEAETPPEILTETLTNATTNQPYNLQLTASGTTPITWTHTGKLPAGLSLSDSGLISGTPTKAGKPSFTITAQNSYGKSSQKFTLQVLDPVSITTASLKAGTIGKSYSVTMRTKGSKTITWTASGLPNGLSINSKGKISGKPTVYGKFSVKFTAQNGAGSITKNLQLEIKAIAPKFSGSLAKPTLNQPYSSSLKATGSTPITWSVEGNLPEGLTFDSETGIISGTPASYNKSGFKFMITASNDAGIKSKKITLRVKGTAPKIKTRKLADATAGQTYSMTLETSAGSEPIEWSATGLPEGLDVVDGVITGTPSAEGTYTVKITATNPVKSVHKNIKLKVNKAAENTNLPSAHDDVASHSESKGDSYVTQKTSERYTPNDKYSYSESYIIVAELGIISSDKEGMHEFGIALPDRIPEGSELVYIANSDSPSEDDEIAEFYDDEGNEVSRVPESRKITISIWLNPKRIYNPAIGIKR